jgi:hypothetical protein
VRILGCADLLDADACATMLRKGRSLSMKVEMPQPDERTLLIVDDEINLGAAIRRMLRNRGYKDDGRCCKPQAATPTMHILKPPLGAVGTAQA